MKKLLKKNEFYLACIIVLYCIIVQLRSPTFFSAVSLVNIINNMIAPTIFAMGMLLVILTGGIDVSFPSMVTLVAYVVIYIELQIKSANETKNILAAFIVIIIGSILLSIANGFLIGFLSLPPLIVTLGTMNVFYGILMGVLNARAQNVLPDGFNTVGTSSLLTVTNPVTERSALLSWSFIVLIIAVALTAVLLHYTMLGRGIYAVGGNLKAAEKAGFRTKRIKFFAYGYLGAMAGLAGIVKICNIRYNSPEVLMGQEMDVIAAVVLGGASLSGGKGSVLGTVLGVGLMTTVTSTLNIMGISGYWQTVVTGAIIVIGISITSYQAFRSSGQIAKI